MEHRAEAGLPPKSKSFGTVIDEYVRFRQRDHRQGRTSDGMPRQIIRVAKFWREYAGAKPVEAIDDKVMRVERKPNVCFTERSGINRLR